MPDTTLILSIVIGFGAGYIVGMVHGWHVDDADVFDDREGWNG